MYIHKLLVQARLVGLWTPTLIFDPSVLLGSVWSLGSKQ